VTTVEVMLPHYGRPALVHETIRSVVAQDDPAWRLTIVDDGTDDEVRAWCAGLGDDRVRYLRNESNLGINRNFQKCVSLVREELVVIIGSDDLMLPNYVRTVRAVHRTHPSAAVIQPGVEVIGATGAASTTLVDLSKRWIYAPRRRSTTVLRGEELAASLLRGNWLYFPSLCWRSEPLRRTGFREGLDVVQDLALVLDLVLDGQSLVVEPTTCFRYRRHRGSVSAVQAADARRFAEERHFFLDAAQRMRDRGWRRAASIARRHLSSRLNALTLLPGAIRRGRSDHVRALLGHALGPSGSSHAPFVG
jgi:glycosyltransferase involved in cell wall biosynthesis